MTEDEEYAQDAAVRAMANAAKEEAFRQRRIDETARALAAVQFSRTNYLSRDHVADIYGSASELEGERERYVAMRRKAGYPC
jgi:hypothetical protein